MLSKAVLDTQTLVASRVNETHLDNVWTQSFAVSNLLDLVHVLFQVEIEELKYEVELGF